FCQSSSIAIVKLHDRNPQQGEDCVELDVDDIITYTFEVYNTGNLSLTNVNITDLLPGLSTITYVSGDGNITNVLEPSESWIYTATYSVTQDDGNAGIVTDQAEVVANTPNGDEISDLSGTDVNSDISTRVIICQTADITLFKEGVFMDENNNGLSNVGESIEYTFTVENTGNVTLYDVKIDDSFLNLVGYPISPSTLEPGQSGTANYTYYI